MNSSEEQNSSGDDGYQLAFTTDYCPDCEHCYSLWEHAIAGALYTAGSIGFVFSFTQVRID